MIATHGTINLMGQKNQKQQTRQLNKKMLERLIIIHNAIKSGLYPDNLRLQRLYCEQTGYSKVGEATINRDIDMLRTYFHAPLEFDRQKGGYYYSDANFEFALNNISAEDVFYLSASKTLLSSFEGSPVYKAISDVIDFVIDTQRIGKSSLLKRIAVPPVPKVVTNEEIWKKVLRSLQENLIVEFDYNGRWNSETTHRRIAPYQILLDDGMCFLFGYDLSKDAERMFYLNRIKNLIITQEHFDLPDDFEFHSRSGGGKFGAFMTEDSVDFVIDFYGEARQYVKDCIWADNQKITDIEEEEKTRIEFSAAQWLKVKEWILSQGKNAIPRSPNWFVDSWKETVLEMNENLKTFYSAKNGTK
ncbi:WYL domain-containing protein [uncultured Treponema sp.]|uniref:helix-turn-helix transcriptional regulator n=1 Tax=uncultured Treponema sp. TaxID=162155 RepID=UPI0025DAF3E1|nr:WYL domain-containing protein [uncultured Treponema sp.]